jgi:hypothetical protein
MEISFSRLIIFIGIQLAFALLIVLGINYLSRKKKKKTNDDDNPDASI